MILIYLEIERILSQQSFLPRWMNFQHLMCLTSVCVCAPIKEFLFCLQMSNAEEAIDLVPGASAADLLFPPHGGGMVFPLAAAAASERVTPSSVLISELAPPSLEPPPSSGPSVDINWGQVLTTAAAVVFLLVWVGLRLIHIMAVIYG